MLRVLCVAILMAGLVGPAGAAIISVDNSDVVITEAAGLDLSPGPSIKSTSFRAYNERQAVDIAADTLLVDYVVGQNLSVGPAAVPGIETSDGGIFLPEGRYDSHIIIFNPGTGSPVSGPATFTLSGRIVGIVVSNNTVGNGTRLLDASDDVLGNAIAYTGVPISRRLELSDTFTLLGNRQIRLNDDFAVGGQFTDEIRIITRTVVPVPPTLALMLGALGGAALLARRRRAAA